MSKRSRRESASVPPENTAPDSTTSNSMETVRTPSPTLLEESIPQGKRLMPSHDFDTATTVPVMKCTLPPHREVISFSTYDEYNVHYAQTHVNRCVECGKNFPIDRFLALHIEENHDPLIEARRARGEKTYGCFVDGCERLCSTPQKRRMHLIDKHAFPRMYNFNIVSDGIDKHRSMLRGVGKPSTNGRRHALAPQSPQLEGRLHRRQISMSQPHSQSRSRVEGESGEKSEFVRPVEGIENSVDDLVMSMSALRFVPTSVIKKQNSRG